MGASHAAHPSTSIEGAPVNQNLSVEQRVLGILTALTAVPAAEIRREDRLREDLGMDSVASMELLSMLSEELAIDVEMEDAAGIHTVAQILDLVTARVRA
jgi:acyl carrier protein